MTPEQLKKSDDSLRQAIDKATHKTGIAVSDSNAIYITEQNIEKLRMANDIKESISEWVLEFIMLIYAYNSCAPVNYGKYLAGVSLQDSGDKRIATIALLRNSAHKCIIAMGLGLLSRKQEYEICYERGAPPSVKEIVQFFPKPVRFLIEYIHAGDSKIKTGRVMDVLAEELRFKSKNRAVHWGWSKARQSHQLCRLSEHSEIAEPTIGFKGVRQRPAVRISLQRNPETIQVIKGHSVSAALYSDMATRWHALRENRRDIEVQAPQTFSYITEYFSANSPDNSADMASFSESERLEIIELNALIVWLQNSANSEPQSAGQLADQLRPFINSISWCYNWNKRDVSPVSLSENNSPLKSALRHDIQNIAGMEVQYHED